MRAGARMLVVIVAMIAVGVGGLAWPSSAQAAGPMACTTKGTLTESRVAIESGGAIVQWRTQFTGTCVGAAGVQTVTGGGFSFSSFDPSPQCAVLVNGFPKTIFLYVNLTVGSEVVNQAWSLLSRYSGPFVIYPVIYRPHPHVQAEPSGAGVVATRLGGKCPGEPGASFTFTFVR